MRSADDERRQFRKRLRHGQTEAERRLWYRLRDRRLAGFKFVQQESVGPCLADFGCRDARLIIEVDGSQHADSAYDAGRDAWLNEHGYGVLRFWNAEVMTNTLGVLDTILAALPSYPRTRGEGRDDLVVGATSPQGDGEGASPAEPPPDPPPHPRLPPRFADDEVGKALSPQAGRGGKRI
ncbi:endonuclease domain-containing protein [Methylorubrum thiocyanatum]